MKTCIVFIDFDGVLNSHAFAKRIASEQDVLGLDPLAVTRLNRLVQETGAQVVVSSSWRQNRTVRELVEILEEAGFEGLVCGRTPDNVPCQDSLSKRHVGERGDEIQAWLNTAPLFGVEVTSFVIIDDDADMRHLNDRLVKTSFEEGLLDEHVNRAIAMLSPALLIARLSDEDIKKFGAT